MDTLATVLNTPESDSRVTLPCITGDTLRSATLESVSGDTPESVARDTLESVTRDTLESVTRDTLERVDSVNESVRHKTFVRVRSLYR